MKNSSNNPINEPLAIVGMSCRFPQAQNLDEFWELLKNKKSTISEISKERWDASKYYDLDPNAERKTYQKQASLLSNIHDFDPLFFNISPAEATEMSPSQKLMLELAWEAMESSSISYTKLKGGKIAVYVGSIWSDFEHYRKAKNARATLHSAVGMSANVIANRVSFTFGFTGPSMVIDTGCSASLVALHLACQSIYSGESEMAIVGGINHIMDPDKYIELTKFGGLSKKGMCSTFDENADGFVRGEGGGALLLKRLSEAERDGDKIFALIRGTAVNNNGFNDTLPATSVSGQLALLETAYHNAGIEPHEVHYMEAHGTGTKLGDPNEAGAIGEFFRRGRGQNKLRVGSIKTNIGHTEATAGIAGLIKVALSMKNQLLAPNLNFKKPSSSIPFEELKIEVQDELTPWPRLGHETLKAGVNSFGWGGTNAHAVLEEYVSSNRQPLPADYAGFTLPISAKSSPAVKEYAKAYVDLLKNTDAVSIQSATVAASLLKPDFDHRVMFSSTSAEGLINTLQEFASSDVEIEAFTSLTNHHKAVFVFPGQGAQWLGMGKDLFLKEKVFRDTIVACDKAFQPFTDWSLIDQLHAKEESSRLNEINVIQPAICAVQIALAKLWISWGVKPHAVVGHSMGEVAAAHIAGILTLEDAAKVICTRSKLMKTMSGKGGAMAVTELNLQEAEKVCSQYGCKVSVAVNNSYKSTVLAGDKECIDAILLDLEKKGLFCRLIKVDVASHSPQMDPIKEDLRLALQSLAPQRAEIAFISTVRSKFMSGAEMNADYWVDNLRGTVQFASAIGALLKEDHFVFVEANPHPALVNVVNDCAEFNKQKVVAVASTYREKPEWESMQSNLTELFTKGYSIDWTRYYDTEVAPHVSLPCYPYQREKYEVEDLSAELEGAKDGESRYQLLGNQIPLAGVENTFFWQSKLTASKFPYLKEHQHTNGIEIPVSFYMELALEAATEVFKQHNLLQFTNMNFSRQVLLNEKSCINVQTKLVLGETNTGVIEIYLQETSEQQWYLAASCGVVLSGESSIVDRIMAAPEDLEPTYTEGPTYYEMLRTAGLHYGNQFQLLTGLNKITSANNTNILFSILPGFEINQTAEKYKAHPVFMTTVLQPIIGQLTNVLEQGHYLNVSFTHIGHFDFLNDVNYERELRGLMMFRDINKLSGDNDAWSFEADFLIANYDNTTVIKLTGLQGTCTRKVLTNHRSAADSTGAEGDLLSSYPALSEDEKIASLEKVVTAAVSAIIKTPASRIKRTMTFKGMGVDSLMAVQLRNALEKQVNMKLAVGKFWNHPSIQQYASFLKEELDAQLGGATRNPVQVVMDNKMNNWFHVPVSKPASGLRLFCFHDAGGSSSLFNQWENYFADTDIELVLVEMPGRGSRLEETPLTDVQQVIDALMPHFARMQDKPFVFLGHSMGGLIAFEVIREMRRRQWQLPIQLFISSTSGLTAYDKAQVDYRLSNDELVSLYPHLALSVIGSVEVQQMLVSILKADLQLIYGYEYKQEELLNMPITVIHGNEDERVKRHQIEQWARETNASFELIAREGGHRYIQHDGEFVASLIKEKIESDIMMEATTNHHFNG
jgi:acyl transferase domain-containing protein/surfactin synthase thioesterase subunit